MYKFLLSVIVLVALSGNILLAQESVVKATFLTTPSDAEIFLDVSGTRQYEKFLGKADKPVLLDLASMKGASGFNIVLRRKGYFPKRERINIGYFRSRSSYPEAGRIRLEPEHWTIWIKEILGSRLGLLGLGSVFLLGLGSALVVSSRRRPDPSRDPLLNQCLGGYLIKEVLGEGASGKVYRAITPDKIDVAIKVYREQPGLEGDFGERFQRECELYKKLNHPNIVPLLFWGKEHGVRFLVMEFVDGSSLAERYQGNPASQEVVVQYLKQAAQALGYAHGMGIIHRDVKPENFLVTRSGKLKLLDFGLAREVLSSLTQTGHSLGTPAYMSPEQIKGGFVDHRCDQYSLGATGYFLLTGIKPFDTPESSSAPILFQQIHGDITPLSEIRPEISEQLSDVVYRLMEREPEKRFKNMDEVVAQLSFD